LTANMLADIYTVGTCVFLEGDRLPRTKLIVELPEGTWINQVSTDYSEAVFRVVATLLKDQSGVGLVEVDSQNLSDVIPDIESHYEVIEFEVLHRNETEALLQFETTNPLILFVARESGVPLKSPFTIQNGKAKWRITAPHKQLSELSNQLNKFGIRFTVEYIRDIDAEHLLTDRQREVVLTAIEEGYYDTPRKASLTEIAERAEVAKSTCSEILHRAEEKIVKQFVQNLRPEMRV
ncbi:MAG: helix-turn-helix domain-containing protein, partial [Halobacteria archaeon]|nr:helix-turn-helix domain-containing protein [Halobacteria archaeon]